MVPGHSVITCRLPQPEQLAAFANRLLKFDWPPEATNTLYRHFLRECWQLPRLSRREHDTLPRPVVEHLVHRLWHAALPESNPALDQCIQAFLTLESLGSFSASAWVEQDIAQLAETQHKGLHGHHFQPPFDSPTLKRILQTSRYRSDWFDTLALQHAPELAYLMCRSLTWVFPWSALLNSLSAEMRQRYPLLGRVSDVSRQVLSTPIPLTITGLTEFLSKPESQQAVSGITSSYGLIRPVRLLLMVEGITEEILLPTLAQYTGLDFQREGILLISAGGKNPITTLYRQYTRQLSIPVVTLLDNDAENLLPELDVMKRAQDALVIIPEGEFEDTYFPDWIIQTVNRCYQPYPPLESLESSTERLKRVQQMKQLWLSLQLGTFDKRDFALKLRETLTESWSLIPTEVPVTIRELCNTIRRVLQAPCNTG